MVRLGKNSMAAAAGVAAVWLGLAGAFTPRGFAANGTLPLSLSPGEGTLPLILAGAAADTTRASSSVEWDGVLKAWKALGTGSQSGARMCDTPKNAHGSLVLGDEHFQLTKLCYDPTSRSGSIEAISAAEELTVQLSFHRPENGTLRGRVTSYGSGETHSYRFEACGPPRCDGLEDR